MKNIEFKSPVDNKTLRGREAVPLEIALEMQQNLIERMIPTEILPYITNDNNGLILEALTMRWMEKYALNFNGFAEYCDLNASNKDFMDRILENNLTNEDYASMQTFLEQSPQGGQFFVGDELSEFIKPFIH
jgi:hypothetical protein